jgi:ABC-2 type transport system ATP-binding protein
MTVVPLPARDAGGGAAGSTSDTRPGAGVAEEDGAGPRCAVTIRGLTKTYAGTGLGPPKTALRGIDLDVPRGAFFGLLGPNGAGKSTLINILAGLVDKTAGTVRVWNHDIDRERRAAKMAIGIVPQELNIDPFFTPKQLLDLQSGLYGLRRSEYRTAEILKALGLADKANAYARTLSGGMRRRLLIGKALLHTPPVVVLDEPTAGVDVELRQNLWTYMRALNAAGTTILLTTHYLEEAERLCDTIAIIDEGELIACAPTVELVARIDTKDIVVTVEDDLAAVPAALGHFDVTLVAPRCLIFRCRRSVNRVREIVEAIHAARLVIADLSTTEGRLEDVFLALTRDRQKAVT